MTTKRGCLNWLPWRRKPGTEAVPPVERPTVPEESEADRIERARKLVEEADRILGEKGSLERVAEALRDASRIAPDLLAPVHWTVLAGHLLTKEREPYEAWEACRRALELDPGYVMAICPMLLTARIVRKGRDAKLLLFKAWEALDVEERELLVTWLRTLEPKFEQASHGETLLFNLSMMGHEELVRALLDRGAAAAARNPSDGNTPLHAAAAAGHAGVVRLLLERGADPEAAGAGGTTPLAFVATMGEPKMAELLVQAGASVDRRDEKGATPLFLAAGESRISMVEKLLTLGADPNAAAMYGVTPLVAAISFPGRSIESGPIVSTVLALLAGGADADKEGESGGTPLTAAAARGYKGCAGFLLDHGARADRKKPDGSTAASIAEENGHEEVAALLRAAASTPSPESPSA